MNFELWGGGGDNLREVFNSVCPLGCCFVGEFLESVFGKYWLGLLVGGKSG